VAPKCPQMGNNLASELSIHADCGGHGGRQYIQLRIRQTLYEEQKVVDVNGEATLSVTLIGKHGRHYEY